MATDTSYQVSKRMPAGIDGRFTFTVYDDEDAFLPAADIDSFTLSLETEAGATINGRNGATNPAPNVSIDSNGLLTWLIQQADSAIQGTPQINQVENHIAIFEWLYAGSTKKGTLKLILECVKLS